MNEGQPLNQIYPLPIEPPPMLEEALGYNGQARFVAFYWGAGDEAYYNDGYISTQGEWDAYLLFVNHPLVAPVLQAYHLDTTEEEATHWLLLDREDRQIAVAPAQIAKLYVKGQWGSPTAEQVIVLDKEAWEQLVAEVVASVKRISEDQIVTHMCKHQQKMQDLSAWLAMKWAALHLSE